MRRALQGLLVLVLLLAALLGAALLMLPRLVDGESVRSRIQQAARESLGRELRYESLELGFLPPSLRVVDTTLSGETPDDPPLLEARAIALRVALLPLLMRTVLVDSLVVEGATLRLTRTADGIALPSPPEAEEAGAPAPAGETADAEPAASSGVSLAVRDVRLRDATLHLVDRAVRPAVTWELREIEASASGESLDGPIDLDLEGALGSGGAVRLEGTATTAGALDLSARLDGVALAPLASYLEDVPELAGRLAGTARIAGPAASPERLEADLRGDEVRFRRGDVALRGAVRVKAGVERPAGEADGSFEVDATGAEIEVGGGFVKPSGTPARVTGRLAPSESGGLAVEDVKLVVRNFEATGRVSSLSPVRAELDAEAFELEGWEALVPALADTPPKGRLRLQGLRYRADPADLRGEVQLDGVVLQTPDAADVVISGLLRAAGTEVTSEDLVAVTAGQTLRVDARLRSLFERPRYRVGLKADGADSNALVTTLLDKPETLFGPLVMDATLSGEAGGDLGALDGRMDFGIAKGRLAGVSLLRAVFDRLGAAGDLALDLGRAFGGRDLQRFYGDEFEVLRGVLDVSDGVARTDDLTFLYRGYGVKLRGTLALADLALDMQGDLTLGPEIDRELAEELKLSSDYTPRERVIRLASVTGTLGAPVVRPAPGTAVQLASAYTRGAYGGRLREKAEEELGPGGGEIVDQGLDILEGILGGRKRPQPSGPQQGEQGSSPETP